MNSIRQQMASTRSKKSEKKKSKMHGKKLSEKGKQKLADIRARQMLEQGSSSSSSSSSSSLSSESILNDSSLSSEDKLILLRGAALAEIVAEESRRKLAAQQSTLNAVNNAARQAKINAKVMEDIEKIRTQAKPEEEQIPLNIKQPIQVISDLLEAGCVGQKKLVSLLESELTQRHLHATDIRVLKASLDATMNGRRSPLNFRVEMLWRFGSTIHDFCYVGSRSLNLKLAIYAYNLLLEKCTPESHPFHYSAIHNSLEQAEHQLDRIEGVTSVSSVNREFRFVAPAESDFMFNFQRKKKKPTADDKNEQINPAAAARAKSGLSQ